jgi:hypothetical protein
MAKFFVIHPVGKQLTIEAGTPVAKAIKAGLAADAYWIRSWYPRQEGKLYCECDAQDEAAIRRVLAKTAPDFPVEAIYPIDFRLDAEDFR